MKKIFTFLFAVLALISLSNKALLAQSIPEVHDQLSLGQINPYFEAYMTPFAKAMAVSMSGGWTHTASVHSTLGFDITLSGSVAMVPADEKTFSTSSLAMPNYLFSRSKAPSLSAGDDVSTPMITRVFNDADGNEVSSIGLDGFPGSGIAAGGMFAIQAGIGLPKGTEVMFRLIPNLATVANNVLENAGTDEIALEKTNMWGFGVKHDIKQWIPAVSKVPFLEISGLFTYSKFQTGFSGSDFRIDPEAFGSESNLPATTWDNQNFKMKMSSMTGTLLIGASIPVFQPFIGVGFNSAKFDGGLNGNFPVIDFAMGANVPGGSELAINDYEKDPISINTKQTNFNFQAGARIKLGFFVFHYTFTAQQYKMHSGGIAFTFR